MNKKMAGALVASIAGFALAASSLASAGASDSAQAVAGGQLWTARFTSPGSHNDSASKVAVSPDGRRVYVTGTSWNHFATVAYQAGTGTRLWQARYTGPGDTAATARSMAVSPDGRRVFVTGYIRKGAAGQDYATVAYRAATGARLWARTYNGPGQGNDQAGSVAVSPSGNTVFVTGNVTGRKSALDYGTVAYNARTGAQLWVRRYDGPLGYDDYGGPLAVTPDGSKIVVTGTSYGNGTNSDFATIAYRAATGARLWVSRYNGPASSSDSATSMVLSPDGSKAFVTGESWGSSTDWATVAYRVATGGRLWVKRYNDPLNRSDSPYGMAVSPSGRTVFVTGSRSTPASADFETIAYRATTGAQLWARRYNGPDHGTDYATALAVSHNGRKLYVTGVSSMSISGYDYATIAYRAATGAQLWLARYNGPGNGEDLPVSVAASPLGGALYVTGTSGVVLKGDYATVAYGG